MVRGSVMAALVRGGRTVEDVIAGLQEAMAIYAIGEGVEPSVAAQAVEHPAMYRDALRRARLRRVS